MLDSRTFLSGLATRGSAPFLTEAETGRSLSCGEAAALAARLAGRLAERGVEPGDRVVLSVSNSLELALAYLACWWLGATAVAIAPATPAEDMAYMLSLAEPRLVIAAADCAGGDFDIWTMTGDLVTELAGLSEAPLSCHGEGPSLITFTSGSTGRPKGVCHSLDVLVGNAAAFADLLALGPADICLHFMPMTYMAGILNTLLCPWVAGGSVVLARQFGAATPLSFWQMVARHRITWMWASPTMLALLTRMDRGFTSPADLKRVFVGTAPLPPQVAAGFADRFGVPVHESYGLSELLIVSSRGSTGDHSTGVGRLLSGVEPRLADHGAARNELQIRTPFRMLGYLDAKSGVLVPASEEWFATGDTATIGADHTLTIDGRIKDLIIRGGINVSPRAVEEALQSFAGVADAAVVGVPDDIYGEEIAAALLLDAGVDFAAIEAGLRAHCQRRLGPTSSPKYLLATDSLPRSSTGKVQKADVRARLLEAIGK